MTRATNTPATRQRRRKIVKQNKGSIGSNTFKHSKEQRMKALKNAYIGRKQRKRFFRKVWISRLNTELRSKYSLRYSRFIRLLFLSGVRRLNRKRLSEIAINEPKAFEALVNKVQNPWPNSNLKEN